MNNKTTIITIIYSILVILIVYFCLNSFKLKEYTNVYKYYNETIIVKIWALYEPNKAFSDIDNIYKENNDLIINEKEDYLNNLVKEYLDKNHYNKYIINMDNTILLSDNEYNIGLPDPIDDLKVSKVIKAKNKCISTYIKGKSSVSVVSDKDCEKTAHFLLNKDIKEEIKYIDNTKNTEAIWNIDNTFYTSKNFNKYLIK